MIRQLVVAAGLISLSAGVATAQFPEAVQPGARVRVWLPEAIRQAQAPEHRTVVRGTVESVSGDALRIAIPGTQGSLTIPRASVRRLDVSKGVSRAASAFERAVGAALAGAVYAAIVNEPSNSSGIHFRTGWQAAGAGAAVGAAVGAVVGIIAPYERWRRVVKNP